MSALPTYPPPGDGPRFPRIAGGWLTASEAAERKGITARAVQLIAPEWQAAGLARLEAPPEGGKARWLISPDADPALKANPAPAFKPCDTKHLTSDQRKALQESIEIYHRWRRACVEALHGSRQVSQEQATAHFLAKLEVERPGLNLSHRTLRRWHKSFDKSGPKGLMDARWVKPARPPVDDRMLKEAERFYLSTKKSKAECFRAADEQATQSGWKVYRESSVRNHLNSLPAARVTYYREGPDAFQEKHGRKIKRTYANLKSNEIWQSDHYHFDVICKVGDSVNYRTGEVIPRYGRPWLTTWIDVRSRKILAFKIRADHPDSGVILEVFRRGCLDHGVPENVYTDNGKDYDARDFTGETKAERRKRRETGDAGEDRRLGIYGALHVGHMHATVYNAQAKLVERLHRTIKEGFCKDFDTYTGGNTTEKPESLPDAVKAGKAPEVEDLALAFAEWTELYNNSIHQGESMDCTPNEAWNKCLENKRVLDRDELDLLLQRCVGPVKVTCHGVRYLGIDYGQYATGSIQDERVYLRVDDADLSTISVWDLAGKFVCIARANVSLPAKCDRELLRAAIREQKQANRALIGAARARVTMHEDTPATMFRLQRERLERHARNRPSNPPPTPTFTPLRSEIAAEMEKYRFALERSQQGAAGGAAAGRASQLDLCLPDVDDSPEARDARRAEFIEKLKTRDGEFSCKNPLEILTMPSTSRRPSLDDICGGAA